MRVRDFEFNLRELAGSVGDFGTLFPLAIGYFAVNGLNPAGLLVMMGLANIVSGIVYRLPMPMEPMKVLASTAIAQRWSPSLIYASGFGTGVLWLILYFTGLVKKVAVITPRSVVRGIQVALGIMLAVQGFKLIDSGSTLWMLGALSIKFGWILGLVSIVIVVLLRKSRYAPAAIVLMLLGIGVMGFRGELAGIADFGFALPQITLFKPIEIWQGLVLAGFAQAALTASNAVIATSALITRYFPDKAVSEQKLALNHGVMNIISPFFGGMPMCHGAGGLAGQYYFGARTGGTNIIEGLIEISLGLFLAGSIAALFALFPEGIIGAMLLLVGIQLTGFARDIKLRELPIMGLVVVLALLTNMAIGFIVAIGVYHALSRWDKTKKYIG